MLISKHMRSQNEWLHKNTSYGSSGHRHALEVDAFARSLMARTILDYGSGSGSLGAALMDRKWPKKSIINYDPAVPGVDKPPSKTVDVVACLDVVEHVEPECLDAVLDHMMAIANLGCFIVAATRSSDKLLPDGRNTHLIVKPGRWWADTVGRIAEGRGLHFLRFVEDWKREGGPHDASMWLIRRGAYDRERPKK